MGFGGSKPGEIRSEINVTPLVDVVLVLLIIFLVTMPVMMKTVTLEVPRKADISEAVPSESIIITYRADQTFVINDGLTEDSDPIQVVELAAEVKRRLEKKGGEKLVFVDFEDEVKWTDVVATMDKIRSVSDQLATRSEDKKNNSLVKVALKKREGGGDDAQPAPP